MTSAVPEEPSRRAEHAECLTALIELERSQIGSEIHDGLLPLVFAAKAAASSLLQDDSLGDDARPRLQQIEDWLTQAMSSGRQLLTQIYPPELTGVPWWKAAEDSLSRLLTDSTTRLHWDLASGIQTSSPDVSLIAYRIVVEAVRNAVTHGRAQDVWIRGRAVADGLLLEIEDNGSGFEIDQVAQDRFGIRSMRARAELIGGQALIESQPGQGTTVKVKLKRAA